MTCNTKDIYCDDESTSVTNSSNISHDGVSLEADTPSSTITDASSNVPSDFKFTNRTPGTLFSHSKQNSNLISYKSSTEYLNDPNCMLVNCSTKQNGDALHKKDITENEDRNITEEVSLNKGCRNNFPILREDGLQDTRDNTSYSPRVSTSLVKVGSLGELCSIKNTKLGISKSYSVLVNELENKCNELETKIVSQDKEISVKNNEISLNKNKLRNVAKMTENFKSSMQMLQNNLDLVQNEKKQYSKTLRLLRDENITIKNRIRSLKNEINESIKKIDLYKSKFNKFKFKLECQNLKIISLNNTVDELSGNLSEEKLKTSSLVQEISQINQNHDVLMIQQQNQLQTMLLDKLENSLPTLIKYESSLIQETFLNITQDMQSKLSNSCFQLKNDFKKYDDFNRTKYKNKFNTLSSQLSSINDNISGKIDPLIKNIENGGEVLFSNLRKDILMPNFAAVLNNSDKYFTKIENILNNVNEAIYQKSCMERGYEEKISEIELHLNDVIKSREEYMDKYQKLQTENAKLEKKNFQTSQQLAHANESLKSALHSLENSRCEIQNLKQQSLVEMETYCKSYESQIESYKQLTSINMDEKSRMKSEANNLLTKITELEKYKLDFDKVLSRNHTLLLEIKHSADELKKSHEDKQLLENKILSQNSKFIEKINQLNKELATLRGTQEKLEEYKLRLKDTEESLEIEKERNLAEKSKSLTLNNKINELNKTVIEITKKRKVEETKFNNNSIALKGMYEDTKKELITEKLKVSKLEELGEERLKEIDDLRQKYREKLELYDKKVIENKQVCLNIESHLKETEKRCTCLTKENNELNVKINDLQSQLQRCNQNNSSFIKKRKLNNTEEFAIDEYSFNNINSPIKGNKSKNRRQKRKS